MQLCDAGENGMRIGIPNNSLTRQMSVVTDESAAYLVRPHCLIGDL
jgi:hypothetical protein